ncbi:hypothetical protein Avbf_07109 [Armadillidium vulgare]|nr:hypothetical protein Avbf_07109 [Armadillidium vulgare]
MSSNDFGDLMEYENEANDRSIMEWDFANSVKYWTGQDADSSLDINDVSLELVQSDTQTQNPKNSGKYFTDSSENFIEKKLSPQQTNVQETFTFTTVSLNKMPTTSYQKKKVTNLVEGSCNEYDSVLETGSHKSHPHLDRNLESNINIKDFPIVSNSSHHSKGIIGYRKKNTSNENLNLPSNLINETKDNDNKESPLRRYYSTVNLKETNINSKGSAHRSSQASISKSRSLCNLSTCKPQNYDNIESKVKKYIQEQKRESKLRRDSKAGTKSLPVTPVRSKERGSLDLDEDYLKNLCLSRKKEKEDLPEDLKKIKQEILEGNIDLNLVEKLFNRLEKEREYSINQNIILNVFQLQYDKLLRMYAEAKNDIDYLRFNRNTNCSEEHSQSGKLGKFSNFKKAFSTSNIFAECSVPYEFGSAKPLSSLIRYSSTPQVHPEITEECKENSEGKFLHLNESFMNECSLSGSSASFKGDVNDWNEKFNHLKQKFSKLSKGLPPETNCKLKLEELHENINIVARNFSLHLPQNFSLIDDDDESAISTPGFCDNLPTSSSYPKLVSEPRCQDKLDFPKSDFSALAYNSRSNDKSKLSFLKYSNARDADSGCPPSDRSTRNSHFPSFDPFESLGTNGIGNEVSLNLNEYKKRGLDQEEVFRRRSIDNLSQISDNCRSMRLNSRKKNNVKKLRSKSLMNLDEDYDASESSEFEDSIYNEDKTRKYFRKPVKSPKTTKYLSKFEDKFICQDQIA